MIDHDLAAKVAGQLRINAESGIFTGERTLLNQIYMDRCKCRIRLEGVSLIYTRDAGYHTSGWWKNPDYERCYHLSLSFFDPETGQPEPFRKKRGAEWARVFFDDNVRKVWIESPYTAHGKAVGVHHYRLFCDAGWQPIVPRGEVYSRELTEAGWKSFSDLHDTK
jgi:hypothetical protein